MAAGGAGFPSSDAEPWRLAVEGSVMTRSGPALTVGAVFAALTVTVTLSFVLNTLSDAVSCSTYVPAALKLAFVTAAAGAEKITVPGPLTRAQLKVMAAGGDGFPSSDAEPWRLAVEGSVMTRLGPALTVGAAFVAAALTVTVTLSLVLNTLSDAVSCSTYVPAALKLAFVTAAAGAEKITVPGPLTRAQLKVMAAGGEGFPSSDAEPWRLAVEGSVMTRSGPALTVGAAFEGALITIGIPIAAWELAGASAVLPALRAHTSMLYEPTTNGVHVKEALVDHACPTWVDEPLMMSHLNCAGATPPVAMAENVMVVPVI